MLTFWDWAWRIWTTASLVNKHFVSYGLPTPKRGNHLYKTYSKKVPRSQGSEVAQGSTNLTIVFPAMNAQQTVILKSIVDTVRNAGTELYMTISTDDGVLEDHFIDIRGFPLIVDYDYTPGTMGRHYNGVELKLNNITVISDPSTLITYLASLSESITVSDSVTVHRVIFGLLVSESIVVSETTTLSVSTPRSVSESVTVTDTITVTVI